MTERREAVEKYLDGEIDYGELEDEIGEEAAEAVRESEKQLEDGEEIAEQLMDNIVSESTLTDEDVEEISRKVDRSAGNSLRKE